MKKYLAEFIGTFVLVFLGTGTVAIANSGETAIGYLGIGLAFGMAVMVMVCAVGGVSGGNFNPAVSLAMMMNKRLEVKDGIFYIIAQFIGAIAASGVLSIFIKALDLPRDGFGQTDFPNVSAMQAFLFEAIITFLFVFVILMVTSTKFGNQTLAPIAIGTVLAFLIIVALNVTGGSLNPARSFGPAIFAGGSALSNYWVYLLAPLVGSAVAAVAAKFMGSEEK
ncbi:MULTISPECIES: MIP family channel protein [Vagococcus]|uniref:Aquaporin Z n=1 Tax=Vagococcus fluvialis bH819 TaxID=1255619 RepID=A0A1X6WRG5_9ENTE|nr:MULTISPECIES: MIP family channel protein [Vagococcus]SLM86822.1 Aquaporin Z [Vagococcus fluvialis bH819]HCM88720.1 MIP family channel protein [Vagococcus sp.]